jgi:hypothetical protein
MRYLSGLFCVVLGLFALVQYNDPDAIVWFLIYAIPATWSGRLAFRPHLLQGNRPAAAAFLVCLAAAIAYSLYLWPSLPAGWIDLEEQREGLGMIIATVGLLVAGASWWWLGRGGVVREVAAG